MSRCAVNTVYRRSISARTAATEPASPPATSRCASHPNPSSAGTSATAQPRVRQTSATNSPATAGRRLDLYRELPGRRGEEDGGHAEIGAGCGTELGGQPHRLQRVTAEIEEAVVDADPVPAEQGGVQVAQYRLDGGAGGDVA